MDKETQTRNEEIKHSRSGYAAHLTSLINTARQHITDKRSKRTLSLSVEKIEAAIKSLRTANEHYMSVLEGENERDQSANWFSERMQASNNILEELGVLLTSKSVQSLSIISEQPKPPTNCDSVGSLPSRSSKASMQFKAEQAKMKAFYVQETTKLTTQIAELEANHVKLLADMQATQVKQEALHAQEMANLEARVRQDLLLENEDFQFKEELPNHVKHELVRNWLDNEHEINVGNITHATGVIDNAQDEVRSEQRAQVNQNTQNSPTKQLNPNAPCFVQQQSAHLPKQFADKCEAIDAWIDRLVPGQETILDSECMNTNNALAQALVKIESERDLPKIDLPRFNGKAVEWPRFIEQFHSQVHSRPGINDVRRMDLLQSHLEGEAKFLVSGLSYSGRNYALALQELKNAFGHRVKVTRAFVDRITSGPVVNSNDPSALRKFYVQLRDCITTLEQFNYLSDLNSSDMLMKIARRLPIDKLSRWNEFVRNITKNREPNLYDLLRWLRDRVDVEFNPFAISVSGEKARNRYAGHAHTKESPRETTVYNTKVDVAPGKQTPNRGSCLPEVKRNNTLETNDQIPKHKMPCPMCDEPHYMYHCPIFANKSVSERRALTAKHKLCFNCLKPSHHAEKCLSTMTCREEGCGRRHHSLLHQPYVAPAQTFTKRMQTSRDAVFFQIVPILAQGPNGRVIQTYALLDSASDTTLIHEQLVHDLGLRGERRALKVTTINCTTTEPSMKVSLDIKSTQNPDAPAIHVKEAWSVGSEAFDCRPQYLDEKWEHIKELNISAVKPEQIQMLIAMDIPRAHLQLEVIEGEKTQPIAVRTMLGWSLMGVSASDSNQYEQAQAKIKFTITSDEQMHHKIEQFWKTESFGVVYNKVQPSSIEDQRAEERLTSSTRFVDGHYQVSMLWKSKDIVLPNNKIAAEKRFRLLAKKLVNNRDFEILYSSTMNGYITKGQARKLTPEEVTSVSPRTWYLPHHGVTSPNKPGKVRVVFDAAASYKNTSLNDNLSSGPDLVNNLFGVIQRFRLHKIAITADVEGMYHQVRVPEDDSDSLRFLWKPDIKKPGPPEEYKMTVHIFGATDSSSCASHALRCNAMDNAENFDQSVIDTVINDFYVDDLLKSLETTTDAKKMTEELIRLMELGGFHLHKWVSNSTDVLNHIPKSERAIESKCLDLDEQTTQRALGLHWNVKSDCFTFKPKFKDPINTKRGVISAVCSIFDTCGYVAPYIVRAKILIQEIWKRGLDWDDQLPEDLQTQWERWYNELNDLNSFNLPRHHFNFSSLCNHLEVHVFADASEKAFGAVAYLRYNPDQETIMCSFLAAKTHVSPIKPSLTIPRLELQGAVLAVRLWSTLNKELHLKIDRSVFWTDSNTVLQYLNNESKRFKPFVANRVAEILDESSCDQWHHVPGKVNPADFCTRGLAASCLSQDHSWFHGPEFLWNSESIWPTVNVHNMNLESDPEVKSKHMATSSSEHEPVNKEVKLRLTAILNPVNFSKWKTLVNRTAWTFRAVQVFLSKLKHKNVVVNHKDALTAKEYQEAELCWIQEAQSSSFEPELDCLQSGTTLPVKSKLLPLSPVFDGRHIRVGGRLRKADIPVEAKYQILLPDDHPVTRLIMEDQHIRTAHGGQEHMIANVRQTYWPLKVRKLAKRAINSCLQCHRERVKSTAVKMADLPVCRVSAFEGVFCHTGIDYFGPLNVKVRRSTIKRWGCLFTCLSTRAVHIELADSLSTDDFILVLRSFIARRGNPKHFYSDNGTNFHGARNELSQCLQNLKQANIANYLLPHQIEWHFNPPLSPHFGGAWERLIRSLKVALKAVLNKQIVQETVLRVALAEVEAVLNSRPLTYNSTDPNDFTALTPNHFLIGRADSCQTPDLFLAKEVNSRRRWRQSQVIADHVCRRWQREYLPDLTVRRCWSSETRSISVGDLVLVVDDAKPRGHWDLARILEILPGDDGRVRTVKLQSPSGQYIRPAAKVTTKVVSLDGDFQLVRKASSGGTWTEAKHAGIFVQQSEVDAFMEQYPATSQVEIDCSDFQAGNSIRSKNENSKLSETAVFGSACRHDFPHLFFSLKHGERIGYSVFLLRKLLEKRPDEKNLHVMYDIACVLKAHLQKSKEHQDLLQKVNLSIPIFHCYGHKAACQVLFSPRRNEGFGLSDGEGMERIWSFLGKFSSITKEMTPENRIDLLSKALLYFGTIIDNNFSKSLVKKMKKAKEVESASQTALQEVLSTLHDCTVADVEDWSAFQKENALKKNVEVIYSKEENYSIVLEKLLKMQLPGGKEQQRLESKAKTLERQLGIERLTGRDLRYREWMRLAHDKERVQLLTTLQRTNQDYQYLIELNRKYSRGQSIAIRLSRQMKKTMDQIKKTINIYNSLTSATLSAQLPPSLTIEDVRDLDSPLWNIINTTSHENHPSSLKNQAVELYFMISKSKEEQCMVKEEMQSTILYYKNQHQLALQFFPGGNRAIQAMLLLEGLHLEQKLKILFAAFEPYIVYQALPSDFAMKLGFSEDHALSKVLQDISAREFLLSSQEDEEFESDEESENEQEI